MDTEQVGILILRVLRLNTAHAYNTDAIFRTLKFHSECPPDLTFQITNQALINLMNDSLIFQVNYDYYSISKEGLELVNDTHPLFTVHHSTGLSA